MPLSSYNKRILIASCGLNPQILTETLYALVHDPIEPFIPTEIHLITKVLVLVKLLSGFSTEKTEIPLI